MNTTTDKLQKIKDKANHYWARRIVCQLEYAIKLSEVSDGRHDRLIAETVEYLYSQMTKDGAVTAGAAREAENMLLPLSDDAKQFQMICVAHAHIDMNWMWSWDETVAIVLDTFRTMLDLMREYPQFTFSQSQASVYRIVEEHDPAMLQEIKSRIREGRWEVTASTWVETDKNMPRGESLARHILYTKRTLSRMLEIDPDSLDLDFEPDTFGHSVNVPEILAKGGVKYYYHCRGYDGYSIYRWKAPSRSSVIVYREPQWYLGAIEPSMANYVPEFCTKHNMDTMLKVYGVGDHGGGPTRRDIERITDMSRWPVYPRMKFGTYGEFFKLVEKNADNLPVVNGELNFVFSGCYTSQSRIKAGNSIMEAKLNEAEAYAGAAAMSVGAGYPARQLAKAWEKVLFNQFHDILPGSGTVETREYAMGQYQQAAAEANTVISRALLSIASSINTADMPGVGDAGFNAVKTADNAANTGSEGEPYIDQSVSEGAGVGFGLSDFSIPQTERGKGLVRVFHLFNPSLYPRNEVVEITVWDWEGDKEYIEFLDSDGNTVPHQLVADNKHYWGHNYFKVLIFAHVPPMGYSTYVLTQKKGRGINLPLPLDPRVERPAGYILENKYIKVVFDPRTAAIVSFVDKSTRSELIDQNRSGGVFRFIEEDGSRGMTAWVVGRYKKVACINDAGVRITSLNNGEGLLRQSISYTVPFGSSNLKVTVSLDRDSTKLCFHTECDFREFGGQDGRVPQLGFYVPIGYECRTYRYGVPSGTIERDAVDLDVPAITWAAAMPKDAGKKALTIASGTKYGFRGTDDSLSLTLIRGSYDPDPYPEIGSHKIDFCISLPDFTSNRELIEAAYEVTHPIRVLSGRIKKGELLPTGSFMAMQEGSIAVQAIKMPEDSKDGSRLIIRGFETEGRRTRAEIVFSRSVRKAYFADINEKPIQNDLSAEVADNHVLFGVEPYNLFTLVIEFM